MCNMQRTVMSKLLLISTLIATSAAQGDILSALLSDAQSLYTAVTSVLAPATTSATASTTSSKSSSTSSSSSSSSSSSISSTSASPTSTPSDSPSPTSSPAATLPTAANAVSGGSTDGNGSNNTLAIVLGCTLGALALAALLGLLYLCLRRRKRSKASVKHRPLSPDDDEIESWRHEKPRVRSLKGPEERVTALGTTASAAPLMTEHDNEPYGYHQHQNPFVPVPPPARRSGLKAGSQNSSYSAHPYSPEHVNGQHLHGNSSMHHPNHGGHTLAAGLGGAALGVLAAHAKDRHERKRSASRGRDAMADPSYSEDEHNALPQVDAHDRRSGSLGRASVKEPWPFMDAHGRRSMDSARSRARSLSRSQEHFSTPDQHPAHSPDLSSYPGFAGAAAAGGLAGMAATHKGVNRSTHKKGILKPTTSDSSDPSSFSDGNRNTPYVTNLENHDSGPHELESIDVPATPNTRVRRDSALGTAAPSAATTAVAGEYRPRSGSSSRTSHNQRTSWMIPPSPQSDLDPPHVPSRSPKRTSLDYRAARYSSANEGTVELPVGTPKHELVSPPLEPQDTYTGDRDGLISPVSPITGSQPGTWSKAQAGELAMAQATATRTTSQESTVVDSASPEHNIDRDSSENSSSDQQSSGLVSAIQRIFSSQKTAWADNENDNTSYGRPRTVQPVGSEDDQTNDDKHAQRRIRTVPRRKPTPARDSLQNNTHSHHGDIARASTGSQGGLDSVNESETAPIQQSQQTQTFPEFQKSIESAHPLPQRRRSQEDNLVTPNTNLPSNISANDFAPAVATKTPSATNMQNIARARTTSGPAYGQGSGDPFDLARTRTDSSMTGISLSNYRSIDPSSAPAPGPAPASVVTSNHSRPWPRRTSSGEPTLAEIRREVQAEDRQRARLSQAKRQTRGLSLGSAGNAGLRYGDDRELFDLVDQSLGRKRGSGGYDRFYGQHADLVSGNQKTNRRSSGGVGWAS